MRYIGLTLAGTCCIAFVLLVLFGPTFLVSYGIIGPWVAIAIEVCLTIYMWLQPNVFKRALFWIFNKCSRIFNLGYTLA